ncbi:TraB/GumN family protein [Pontibacter sp. JAM-7]|uniref:TraB/GumN family protein n=1 Tax=Pontibacter sp. JAM-7 TaxID=3366581 RepID=UPI003AF5BCC3
MPKYISVLVGLCLGLVPWCHAEGPVWRITQGNHTLYLAGTIHLLAESDLPLPKVLEQAYQVSDAVVFETDIGHLQQPQVQWQLMQRLIYPPEESLRQHIPAPLYARLTAYALENNLSADTFLRLKPAGVMLTLLNTEFQRLGIHAAGPDMVYHYRAQTDGKPTQGLESVKAHLDYIATLGLGNETRFIQQSLDDLAQTKPVMREIVTAWKRGDRVALSSRVIGDMQQAYPEVYQRLLVARNIIWLPAIEALLETPSVEMVLVGAAHLVGADGLLQALESRGYAVEQL